MDMLGKLGLITLAGFIAAASTSLGISPALAGPITYNETDIASGSLNGVSFTDATIVLNENTDPNTVTGSGIYENFGTVTLSVNGGTPVTLTRSSAPQSAASGTVSVAPPERLALCSAAG